MRRHSSALLAALAARQPVEPPVALVVAHPDDETLAAGGSLHLFRQLLLIHVTDGAPLALDDARRAGFASPAAYAGARARELDAALALADAAPTRVALDIADQGAIDALPAIAARLRELFRAHEIGLVLTHCYEGGHPDHDAVAFAVHATAPEIVEFAGYHRAQAGGLCAGKFLQPGAGCRVALAGEDLARKRAMLACFRSQQAILVQFDPGVERFRPAPRYDFTRPPHPGPLLYEEWGWTAGADWRRRAAAARCAA